MFFAEHNDVSGKTPSSFFLSVTGKCRLNVKSYNNPRAPPGLPGHGCTGISSSHTKKGNRLISNQLPLTISGRNGFYRSPASPPFPYTPCSEGTVEAGETVAVSCQKSVIFPVSRFSCSNRIIIWRNRRGSLAAKFSCCPTSSFTLYSW